ncbi:hypothetical protein D3C87_1519520 [compost metagenome]
MMKSALDRVMSFSGRPSFTLMNSGCMRWLVMRNCFSSVKYCSTRLNCFSPWVCTAKRRLSNSFDVDMLPCSWRAWMATPDLALVVRPMSSSVTPETD